MDDGFAERVSKVGALTDPIRRALYHFVAYQPGSVSRDQAAAGVDVPRHTAKFHLDRLVEEGLLVTEFRRLTGRTGPGAGRPAKLYRRNRREITVSLPRRRYDLASQVLADAVERTLAGAPMRQALADAADEAARAVVESTRDDDLTSLLDRLGYEPKTEGDALALRNCPYQQLSSDHRDLVCPINADFVTSVARRLGCTEAAVERVDPSGGCCVRVSSIGR